jgi:hypothetical protein
MRSFSDIDLTIFLLFIAKLVSWLPLFTAHRSYSGVGITTFYSFISTLTSFSQWEVWMAKSVESKKTAPRAQDGWFAGGGCFFLGRLIFPSPILSSRSLQSMLLCS